MRICSSNWTKIAARGDFCFEAKAKIGNKEYTAISAPEITRSIASAPLSVFGSRFLLKILYHHKIRLSY